MKKLMVVAAVAIAAVAVQAGSFDWKNSTMSKMKDGTTDNYYSGTVFLFDAGATTQKAVFDALVLGTDADKITGYLDTQAADTGVILPSDKKVDYTGSLTGFIAAVTDDQIYISDLSNAVTIPDVGSETLTVKNGKSNTIVGKASDGYAGNGWYTTVPEPTSGLLLLLGVAGLALKRRRA